MVWLLWYVLFWNVIKRKRWENHFVSMDMTCVLMIVMPLLIVIIILCINTRAIEFARWTLQVFVPSNLKNESIEGVGGMNVFISKSI